MSSDSVVPRAQSSLSKGLEVRRATADDAAAYVRIMSDPTVFATLLGMPFPDVDFWRKRLSQQPTAGQADLRLVGLRDGEVIATAALSSIGSSARQRHVAALGMAVASKEQGQGVGTAMLAALVDYADGWAGLLRIELTVVKDNSAAIALYRKFGFEVEGTRRCDILRDGQYVDSLSMSRLHPNAPQLSVRSQQSE